MTDYQDAVEILDDLFGDTPGYREGVADAAQSLQIASLIYEARTAAGLSQKQLADKIHSRQSAISRLEDADYEGHSLTMLRRIASALGLRLDIKLLPAEAQHALVEEEPCIATTWRPEALTSFVTDPHGKKRIYEDVYGKKDVYGNPSIPSGPSAPGPSKYRPTG